MSISALDSMYVPGSYYTNRNMPFKQTVSQPVTVPTQQAEEPSLASQLASSALIMGPIMGRKVIMHPIQSTAAAKSAGKIYQSLLKDGALSSMSAGQKVDVFNNLYNAARYKGSVLKEGLRTQADTSKLASEIAKAQKGYIDAIKAGDTVAAAQNAAQVNTIISKGGKGFFGGVKDASTVIQNATEAGNSAAKAATAAIEASKGVATATSATGKALAWGKDAFMKQGGPIFLVIEGAIEAPEVYTAFSEGGTVEGVKQTAKSAVKVAGSVGGWCVGAKAGAAAGAAIGSALCPGLGTAIGSAIGTIVGGITGSWAGNKAAKAIAGKSYSEKKEELALKQQTQPQYTYPNPFAVPGMYPTVYDIK